LIDSFLGQPLQIPERYTDFSGTNLLMHMTYAFGLIPQYAYRTPLPDWSLGLEMQFYAVFPFIVIIARNLGWLPTAVFVSLLSLAIALVVHRLGVTFPMPSFLPLKMQLFVAGILIAAAIGQAKGPYLALGVVLAALPLGGAHDLLHIVVREIVLTGFFLLVHGRSVPWIDRMSAMLGASPFHWLGELSFGVYLIHLLILHPVAGWIIQTWGHTISSGARFGMAFGLVAPVSYGIAYFTYQYIEMPGQHLGRNVSRLLKRGTRGSRTVAEV
jgi:peptidoglycan/LPS O-acetylase OafA/YrhL